jgi:hypothetical protein
LHYFVGSQQREPTYIDIEISTAKAAETGRYFFASGILSHIHQKRSKKTPPCRQRALANNDPKKYAKQMRI